MTDVNKLSFLHLGNGITVFDTGNIDRKTGDYLIVATIDMIRRVNTRMALEPEVLDLINSYAKHANPTISASQSEGVFVTKADGKFVNLQLTD